MSQSRRLLACTSADGIYRTGQEENERLTENITSTRKYPNLRRYLGLLGTIENKSKSPVRAVEWSAGPCAHLASRSEWSPHRCLVIADHWAQPFGLYKLTNKRTFVRHVVTWTDRIVSCRSECDFRSGGHSQRAPQENWARNSLGAR
jgi:hypothetical protein